MEGEIVDAENDELVLNEVDDEDGQPFTPGERERGPMDDSKPFCGPEGQPWAEESGPFAPTGPAPDQGMMPLEQAVAAQAEMRRQSARIRPIQRALPPGRS